MFITALGFMVIIVWLRYRQQRRKNAPLNVPVLAYFGALALFVSLFFFNLLSIGGGVISGYLSEDKIQATVVDYDTRQERNSEGETYTSYTPVLEFTDAQGETQHVRLNHSSSNPISKGKTITIHLDGNERATNLSLGTEMLSVAMFCVFFVVISYGMCWLVALAAGWSTRWLLSAGIFVLLWLVFPAAMLGFIAAFGTVLWDFIVNQNSDTPIWVLAFCSFGMLMLLAALYGYMLMLFGKGGDGTSVEELSDVEREKLKEGIRHADMTADGMSDAEAETARRDIMERLNNEKK